MAPGYQSKVSDIVYLLEVASAADRDRVAGRAHCRIEKNGDVCRFFERDGSEITIEEFHRRTQADPDLQRHVYNVWMTYAH